MAAPHTPEQRAIALSLVTRHGGKVSRSCLADIAVALGKEVPARTVRRWVQGTGGQGTAPGADGTADETAETLTERTERGLDELFEEVAHRYLAHALKPDVVAKMGGKEAVLAASIAFDKLRLIRLAETLPTAVMRLLPDFLARLAAVEVDPVRFLDQTMQRLDIIEYERYGHSESD